MPLWGNKDYPTQNNKPLYANTSNSSSNSTINGTAANSYTYYGIVAGVSANETYGLSGSANHVQHSGWVSVKVGTGPVKSVSITNPGTGINAAGFIVVSDTSPWGQGSNANISFTIANTQNTLQAYSTNPAWNGVATATIVSGGAGYSNTTSVTYKVSNPANTTQPTLTIALGGRADRYQVETLVAMGSITLDDPRDNVWFSGI